jgi:hypothetical protein
VARRSILVAMAAAIAAVWPASAFAATAPSAPQLMTAPWISPAIFQWTPGADLLNATQTIYRAPGACTTPLAAGQAVRVYPNNTRSEHFATPGDGVFCFFIRATDLAGGTADSSGITIGIDTTVPTATVAVSGQGAGGVISGTVNVSGSSADAVSGVASSALRVGAVGACSTGSTVPASWNTTRYTDGVYDVCNVVTDNAGHTATAAVTVTIVNASPIPTPVPAPSTGDQPSQPAPAGPSASAPAAAGPGAKQADKDAPHAPTRLAVVQPRAGKGTTLVPLTVRWVNPVASDLDRVVVVLNVKHAPRGRSDGTVIYSGLRPSAVFKLRAGKSGYLALFAYDRSGNVSPPARRAVSLASLVPLRPLTGSVVSAPPRLTWKAKQGTAYYNVQVFHNGKRMLVGWPSQASFRLQAPALEPGIYTWFVWPAIKHTGGPATFGDLIGRATFVYKA